MNKEKTKHNEMLDSIVERLVQKGHSAIHVNTPYCRYGVCGDIDIMTYRNGIIHIYEYKTKDGIKQYKKALSQFEKIRQAYPYSWRQMRFIYIAGTDKIRAKRVYL